MKRSRRKPLSPEEREQKEEFVQAGYEVPCANCKKPWTLEFRIPHHVIEKQELKDRHLPPNDPRNALSLCPDCHANHHFTKRVPFRKLRAANIDYAYEVLGPFAADYLRKKYPMAEENRVEG